MKINVALMEDLRKEKGLSMSKISKMIGYKSEGAYQNKIKGRRKFNIKDLHNISIVLNVNLNKLIQL